MNYPYGISHHSTSHAHTFLCFQVGLIAARRTGRIRGGKTDTKKGDD